MKTYFNGTWYTVERNNSGGVDMQKYLTLIDVLFAVAMLGMGALLMALANDCDTVSNSTKAFCILSGGILAIYSAISLD
jgi:hypothetical protein